jgi:hypothetical protein
MLPFCRTAARSQNDCRLSQDGSGLHWLMEPGCDAKVKDVCNIVYMCCVYYFCFADVFGVVSGKL